MSCKELIEIFKEIGDKMICDYNTKKCTFFPQNLSCDISPDSRIDIENLIGDLGLKPYTKLYHIPTPSWNSNLERLHRFQIKNTYGMIMEINKESKEWYQKKIE